MSKEVKKTNYVGVRLTEEQATILSKIQLLSELNKTEILVRGLDLLGEFYENDEQPSGMTDELRALEEEALHHSLELKKVRKKEKAIKDSIKELRDIDTIIDKHNCDKSALIQILLDIQKKYNWLPNHALLWTSERLNIPMSQILNIATFYKAFSLEEKGKHTVKVCLGTACHVRGGPEIMRRVEEKLGVKSGETTEDGMFTVESVNCLGCCALGPVMMVDDEYHGKLEPAKVEGILASYREAT